MGRIDKGVNCSVPGCNKVAVRSVSGAKAERSGLGIKQVRQAYLCKEHYKELKKNSREERRVEKWRWSQ